VNRVDYRSARKGGEIDPERPIVNIAVAGSARPAPRCMSPYTLPSSLR
jgi:hypothetical protein